VYVQAVPSSVPTSTRGLSELSAADLRMAHSSKLALKRAMEWSDNITALGHSSILREALARGASDGLSVPLYDDPLKQAESMREILIVTGESSAVFVGENLEGPFSGASLCGALSAICKRNLYFGPDSDISEEQLSHAILLLRDPGNEAFNIDIRRIDAASKRDFESKGILGNSTVERIARQATNKFLTSETPEQLASVITRKLRRLAE
jgi:hypothetical protein